MLWLSITRFDADPEMVSDILDLRPTFVGRIGEVSPKSGRPYGANLWSMDAYPDRLCSGADHEAGLTAILALLSGREQRFAQLRQEVRPEIVSLYGGIYTNANDQCGVWLNPEQMRILTDCEVGWGLDIFIAD